MLGRERDFPAPGRSPFRTYRTTHTTMEAASIPAGPPASQRIRAAHRHVRAHRSCCSPCRSCYAIRISATTGNLVRLGENMTAGISNGAIWALVAIGYTLVYGIVELINFAHGEVFMIGSFISAVVLRDDRAHEDSTAVVLFFGLLLTLVVAMVGAGTLNAMIERVAYRPLAQRAEAGAADHRGRHLLHPAERRPALEGRHAAGHPRPDQRAAHARHDLRHHDRERRHARRSRSRSRC